MPLILEPETYPRAALEELLRSLTEDLAETRALVEHPRGRPLDPTGLGTARELIDATIAALRAPGATPRELADRINLAYATMVASVDLVKCHTDVPRVPRGPSARAEA